MSAFFNSLPAAAENKMHSIVVFVERFDKMCLLGFSRFSLKAMTHPLRTKVPLFFYLAPLASVMKMHNKNCQLVAWFCPCITVPRVSE